MEAICSSSKLPALGFGAINGVHQLRVTWGVFDFVPGPDEGGVSRLSPIRDQLIRRGNTYFPNTVRPACLPQIRRSANFKIGPQAALSL